VTYGDPVIAARSVPLFRGRTILIVEDHDDSRELVVQILRHEGAIVLAAHDAQAALQTLEARIPDVILTDLLMPGLDGLAFTRRVKADARWARVPIIAVTALGSPADRAATVEAGCAAHVTKPINWETLMRTIERVVPSARGSAHPPRQHPPRLA
jgi:CheY-like chemotaxis protein